MGVAWGYWGVCYGHSVYLCAYMQYITSIYTTSLFVRVSGRREVEGGERLGVRFAGDLSGFRVVVFWVVLLVLQCFGVVSD